MANKKKNYIPLKKVSTQETTEKKTVETIDEKFTHKVKSDCGFKRRNYYVNNQNVLLIAGKGILEEHYNCFSKTAREKYFEEI